METSHLLILGAPRSGTTLLATMISLHTDVAILNEDKGWAMRQILGKTVVGNKRCVPNQIELKKRPLLHFRFLKSAGIAKEYQSSKHCIEDHLNLPSLKVIGLIRSGNDVVSSIMNRSEKSFRVAAYRWCRAIEILYELQERVPDRSLIVSFESLVLSPKNNMERICAFLNVDYQARMLEGPQHNPWYPEEGMNQGKVHRADKEKIDYKLGEKFPEVCRKYEALLTQCRVASDASAPECEKDAAAASTPSAGGVG